MVKTDFACRAHESLERSQDRRKAARKSRTRRLRLRGGALYLCTVALATGAVGVGASFADDPGALAGASSAGVVLHKGDRGRAVAAVQRRLRVAADGVFGSGTERAVKRFQRRKRLQADGIVGPATRRALRLRAFAQDSVDHAGTGGSSPRGGSSDGPSSLPSTLRRIARCESGGNPRAVSRDGRYRGKYQFMRSTWKSLGGRGSDPARASEAEQDRVAIKLYRSRGTAPWPSCGA